MWVLSSNPKDMMAFIHTFEYARGVGSSLSKELFDGLFKLGDGNIYQGFFHPREDVEDILKSAQRTIN